MGAEIIGYLLIGTDNSAAKIAAQREKVAEEMFHQAVESSSRPTFIAY
jgi:hypothetical protein